MNKKVTQFYCHECGGYIKVALDYSLNGNHIVKCPKCDHEHCRVIQNGEITSDRWDSRNTTYDLYVTMSSYSTSSSGNFSMNPFAADMWASTGSATSACTGNYYFNT